MILVLAGVGFWFFFLRTPEEAPATMSEVEEVVPPAPTPTPVIPPAPRPAPPAPPPPTPVVVDTDGDGLTDTREEELGTDPTSPDTDDDELFDKEEVDVYGTDPTDPDTDGDTFRDGTEVRNGYNPKGPGRLFEIPQP